MEFKMNTFFQKHWDLVIGLTLVVIAFITVWVS